MSYWLPILTVDALCCTESSGSPTRTWPAQACLPDGAGTTSQWDAARRSCGTPDSQTEDNAHVVKHIT